MCRGVLEDQGLAGHGEALFARDSPRTKQSTGLPLPPPSKKLESASKKSMDPRLRVSPDTDQTTFDEGLNWKF
jgi:hypothetical protein